MSGMGCKAICVLASLLAATGAAAADLATGDRDAAQSRVAKGFQLAPVPLDLRGLERRLVGLGSYIVNAQGGCNDCHTNPPFAPGGDPFQGQPKKINVEGYLAGGMSFGPDEIVSPNLTPDASRRPGGMTLKQFLQAMRLGHDPDEPGRLLQVMPWPVYAGMTDLDLRAIYEYLRAIPPRQPAKS